jgi:transposase
MLCRRTNIHRRVQASSAAELERVEVVVLDMSKTYASAIQDLFGESVQVIDRFHVVKRAVDALDDVMSED